MNTTGTGSDKDVVKAKSQQSDRPDDARLALLRTLRDLRRSVAARRPMTLPNCLRLCRRRLADAGNQDAAVLDVLASVYRKHQPFPRGPKAIRLR